MSDERPFNRRSFFREGLRELLKKVQQAAEPLAEAAKQFSALEQDERKPTPPPQIEPYNPAPVDPYRHWLRPPGAVPEQQFRDTCSRCGECTRICPVQCIKLDYGGENGAGVPYIDPDEVACILCDGLLCTNYCPSGSILSLTGRTEVNMGVAQWQESMCLRTTGQPCSICVDRCPIGETAIAIVDNRIEVRSPGCVGCGVCQHECPTMPKSITVLPKAAMMQ